MNSLEERIAEKVAREEVLWRIRNRLHLRILNRVENLAEEVTNDRGFKGIFYDLSPRDAGIINREKFPDADEFKVKTEYDEIRIMFPNYQSCRVKGDINKPELELEKVRELWKEYVERCVSDEELNRLAPKYREVEEKVEKLGKEVDNIIDREAIE